MEACGTVVEYPLSSVGHRGLLMEASERETHVDNENPTVLTTQKLA
jgi:hypothetical protein